jgi:hypothetical protein
MVTAVKELKEVTEKTENLVYKLFGQSSDVLINVFEIKLTIALEVERNI